MARVISDDDIAPAAAPAAGRVISDDDVAINHQEQPGLGQQVSDFFSHTLAGVSGAVGGASSLVKNAFTNPTAIVDAAHEELKRSADEIQKGKDAWKAGDHGKAIAHWKMAVPIMGPMDEQLHQEAERGEGGAEFGDFLGFMAGAKLLHEAGKAVPKIPGAARSAASGIRAAAEATANAVKNPADAVGNAARAVPESVTSGLSKVEKAATLRPVVSDAIEMVPGAGAPIAAGARTLARGARTANRLITKARTLGADAPPTRGAAPAEGVAYPGAQDPAAIEPRTPVIDTSTEPSPEQEASAAGRQAVRVVSEDDIAPAKAQPYPGQTDPAAVQPMTPAIDEAVAATPVPTGRVSASVPQSGPPAAEAVESTPPASGPVSTPETKVGKYALKPGEGTHLELDLKEGEVPAAKDYQAAARKVWAGHMATRLNAMGVTPEAFGQMTQTQVDALAKDIGIKASSPEKIALVMDKLQAQPNVALPELGKATEQSAKPVQPATRKPVKRAPSIAERVGGQLMGD